MRLGPEPSQLTLGICISSAAAGRATKHADPALTNIDVRSQPADSFVEYVVHCPPGHGVV